MDQTISSIHEFIVTFVTPERISQILRLLLILLIGIPIARLLAKIVGRLIANKLSPQSEMLIKRAVLYAGFLIVIISFLNELGFKLSALLGAAGIFGVAIGFASQTSVSNIISGIFLISEKPFQVTDTIQIGDIIGTVISIDLLSVKLRTPDNRFVRIPNEDLIKTRIYNISKYPVRALEIKFVLPYTQDLNKSLSILQQISDNNPLVLKTPEATFITNQLTLAGVEIFVSLWTNKEDYVALKHSYLSALKERFDAEQIEFPALNLRIPPSM